MIIAILSFEVALVSLHVYGISSLKKFKINFILQKRLTSVGGQFFITNLTVLIGKAECLNVLEYYDNFHLAFKLSPFSQPLQL